jgi:hypothetical protein
MIKFEHINDCVEALEACKTIDEVYDTLDNFPRKFGEWWVDTVGEGEDAYYEVTNEYYDPIDAETRTATYDLEIEVEEDE